MSDTEGMKAPPAAPKGWTDKERVRPPPSLFPTPPKLTPPTQLTYLFALIENSGAKFDFAV